MHDAENPNLLESVRMMSTSQAAFSKTSRLSVPYPESPSSNYSKWKRSDPKAVDLAKHDG